MFIYGDVIRPVGLILNHDDPSDCFVLFLSAAPMQDIYSLSESPSWVGAHIQLIIKKPHLSILPIVIKLLADKALEEGGSMNISQLNLWNPKVLGNILLPKEGEQPVATALAKQLKSLESQKLQQIMSAI